MELEDLTIICADNDLEARLILDICRRLGVDLRVSGQPHGARLEREPAKNFRNLKKNVAIVEIPGIEIEEKLASRGHKVIIIDHHQYIDSGMDRRNKLSSLEQVAELLGYELSRFEKGVAIYDRSYFYGMVKAGYSREEIMELHDFEREVIPQEKEKDPIVMKATAESSKINGIHIINLPAKPAVGVSQAAHFLVIENLPEIQNILAIYKNDKGDITRIAFSGEQKYVEKLKPLGGWSGGDPESSMFWSTRENILEKVEAILFK